MAEVLIIIMMTKRVSYILRISGSACGFQHDEGTRRRQLGQGMAGTA